MEKWWKNIQTEYPVGYSLALRQKRQKQVTKEIYM